jgi:hypothetical protein
VIITSASDARETSLEDVASVEEGAPFADLSLSLDPDKAVLTPMKSRRAAARITECFLGNVKDLISISL